VLQAEKPDTIYGQGGIVASPRYESRIKLKKFLLWKKGIPGTSQYRGAIGSAAPKGAPAAVQNT
jgi:hypothetical protein